MTKALKRLKIIGGKFMLEGKTVEVEPICLTVINLNTELLTKDPTEYEKELMGEGFSPQEAAKMSTEEIAEELKKLREASPHQANAYVVGDEDNDEVYTEERGGLGGFAGSTETYYAVLFVRIK